MRIETAAMPRPGLPRAIAPLVESVATERFGDALLGSMRELWDMKFVAVYAFDADAADALPDTRLVLGAASETPDLVGVNSGKYTLRYAHRDPARCAVLATSAPAATMLAREELPDPGHQLMLERARVVDRYAYFFPVAGRRWLSVHAMRGDHNGPITRREFGEMRDLSPLFRALIWRHLGGSYPARNKACADERLRAGLRRLCPALSDREVEICSRLLAGRSSPQIARELKLGVGSVQTYRKRAYLKLGVSDMREIFARLLGLQ